MNTHANTTANQLKQILFHVFAWILYVCFIYGANFIANPQLRLLPTLFFLLPHCISFYMALFFLNLYKEKGPWWSVASFFLVFLIMAGLGYLYVYYFLPLFDLILYRSTGFADYLKSVILGYVQYFSYALLYFYVREHIRKEKRLRKLEADRLNQDLEHARLKEQELQMQTDKLSLEYAFLRAQVNPHFLHNSLNALFSQAMDHSQELADNIAKLSRIMRYSMESARVAADRVPVELELEHLKLFIDFYKLRFDDQQFVQYAVEGVALGQFVPPLSFITIVENAFKYGDLKQPDHPLEIQVHLQPGTVQFRCRNRKAGAVPSFTSHSIGLTNLRKRLELSFAQHYTMNVTDDEWFYEATLTLKS